MGVGVIYPFFTYFSPFFTHFSPFSSLFSSSPKGQGQTTAIYSKNGEFHSEPVCTDLVQNFPIPGQVWEFRFLPSFPSFPRESRSSTKNLWESAWESQTSFFQTSAAFWLRRSLTEDQMLKGQDFHFLLQNSRTSEGFLKGSLKGSLKGPRNCQPKDPWNPLDNAFKNPSETFQKPFRDPFRDPSETPSETLQKRGASVAGNESLDWMAIKDAS